jgi:hypothetical protein
VVARTVCALRRHIVSSRQSERRSLIPTVGALPGSHVALIAAPRADSHRGVVVSIFVNPKQSAPGEDLATYRAQLNPIELPWYGPVCPVVWEGRRRETPRIPITTPFGPRTANEQQQGRAACGRSDPWHGPAHYSRSSASSVPQSEPAVLMDGVWAGVYG